MSSGDSEPAPSYYFSGIIFNPDFYISASSTYLTQATAKLYFLSYPFSQGSEIFTNNLTLQSTLTDSLSSVGTSGQLLSSTGTGTSWIDNTGGSNSYIALNTSSFPYTLPTPTRANTYVYITGTVLGGALRIPTTGVSSGTFINFRNFTNFNINLTGTTFLLFSRLETALSPYILNIGSSASFYYNGTIWVQTTVDRTMLYLDVVNQLTVGSFLGDTIWTKDTGIAPDLYGNLLYTDLNIANVLPAPYTVRIANTTSGASGGSVHCSNIGFDGSNINNATNPGIGTIKLGNSLTSGPLYIAGGSSTAAHTSGPVIINSDSTATGGINIGTGTDLTAPTVNTINIGSSTYATNILGTLSTVGITSASGGITATTGNIQASGGNVIAQLIRNGANTGSISQAGVLTGTSLVLGTGAITTVGNITSTGAITASSITTPSLTTATAANLSLGTTLATSVSIGASGITTTVNGTLATSVINSNLTDTAGNTSLNIGSNVVLGNIVIGNSQTTGDIIIGASDIAGAVITVGTASTATTINGTLTANNGLTLGNGYGITCGTTAYTPTSSQLGYTSGKFSNALAVSLPSNTNTIVLTITNIPIGNYIIVFAVSVNSTSSATTYASPFYIQSGMTLITPWSDMSPTGGTATTNHQGGSWTGFLNVSASTNSLSYTVNPKAGGSASVAIGDASAAYMRIG